MKKLLTLAAAALLASSVANATDWYLVGAGGAITKTVGSEDKTNANWTPGEEMCKFTDLGGGKYTWSGKKIDGDFKICDGTSSWDNSFGLDNCSDLTAGTYNLGYKKGNLKLHMNNPTITINKWQISYGNDYMEITISGDVIEQNNEKVVVTWNLTDDKYYYFFLDNNKEWDIPKIYTWNDELFGGWSGAKMSYMTIGDKEYCVARYDKTGGKEIRDNFGMIFTNDGNDNSKVEPKSPTPNVVYSNDDNNKGAIVGYIVNGAFSTTKPSESDPDPDPSGDDREVQGEKHDHSDYVKPTFIKASDLGLTDPNKKYFIYEKPANGWDSVNVYAWSGDTQPFGAWTGKTINNTNDNTSIKEFDGKTYFIAWLDADASVSGYVFLPTTGSSADNRYQVGTISKDKKNLFTQYPIYTGILKESEGSNCSPVAHVLFDTEVNFACFGNDITEHDGSDTPEVNRHKDHVAIHPDVVKGTSFTLNFAHAEANNAFYHLADGDELKDHVFVTVTPVFDSTLHQFMETVQAKDEDGNPIWIKDEEGNDTNEPKMVGKYEWNDEAKTYVPVYTGKSVYKEPTVYKVGYDKDTKTYSVDVRAEVAGQYDVKVELDDHAYNSNLTPFNKTFRMEVLPSAESIGINLFGRGTTYTDEDKNTQSIFTYAPGKVTMKVNSKGDLTKCKFGTADHVPSRTLKIYYKFYDKNHNDSGYVEPGYRIHKANSIADEVAPEGYTLHTNEIDLTPVQKEGKGLSLIVSQNGTQSDPIDFEIDNDDTVTAIESVAADVETVEAQARYFTLQGVEVSRLVPGIYIMVKGNESSKILVK